MNNSDIELFQSAVDLTAMPSAPGRLLHRHDAASISTVDLGRMLAQVVVVPMDVEHIDVIAYGGDEQMLAAIEGTVSGGVLRLRGQLPFKPGSPRNGGGVNLSGVVIGSGITVGIGGGTVIINGHQVSGGSGEMMIIDGREIDLSRAVQLVVVVPHTVDLTVDGLIGEVGLAGDLDGVLDFTPTVRTRLAGRSVRVLRGEITGSGTVTLAGVHEDATVTITGSGRVELGRVGGVVDARITGSGRVSVTGGTSRSLRALISGSGRVVHQGRVLGGARLQVTGSGRITAATVDGHVDQSISGHGSIRVNGRDHHRTRF